MFGQMKRKRRLLFHLISFDIERKEILLLITHNFYMYRCAAWTFEKRHSCLSGHAFKWLFSYLNDVISRFYAHFVSWPIWYCVYNGKKLILCITNVSDNYTNARKSRARHGLAYEFVCFRIHMI